MKRACVVLAGVEASLSINGFIGRTCSSVLDVNFLAKVSTQIGNQRVIGRLRNGRSNDPRFGAWKRSRPVSCSEIDDEEEDGIGCRG